MKLSTVVTTISTFVLIMVFASCAMRLGAKSVIQILIGA
jgi:hypothetical protein